MVDELSFPRGAVAKADLLDTHTISIILDLHTQRRTNAEDARLEAHSQSSPDPFFHEGQPSTERAKVAGQMGEGRSLWPDSRRAEAPTDLHLARWASLCQWPHSPGDGAQQDFERLHSQVEDSAGIQCPLPPGLGLPRITYRNPRGQRTRPAESPNEHCGNPPGLPALCGKICEYSAAGLHAPGSFWRVGKTLSHHGF